MANDNGITIGQLTEQLNQKMDLPTGVSQDTMDYVVEWKTPTENDPTWYRKYKSGWIEQGGIKEGSGDVTFLKPFINANYTITTSMMAAEAHYYSVGVHINPTPSTTGFTAYMWNNAAAGSDFGSWYWKAEGQGA